MLNPNYTIDDLSYADDIALLADNVAQLQIMIDSISSVASSIGLHLNSTKCKVMSCCATDSPVLVNDYPIEYVPVSIILEALLLVTEDAEQK